MTVDRILLAAGSRSCADRSFFVGILATYRLLRPGAVMYVGDSTGADTLFRHIWANLNGHGNRVSRAVAAGQLRVFNADWTAPCRPDCKPGHRQSNPDGSTWCPAAGPRRNQEMCDAALAAGLPVDVIAVRKESAGNRGTHDCTRRAHATLDPVIEAFLDLVEAQFPRRR